jgi:hypothetical protein
MAKSELSTLPQRFHEHLLENKFVNTTSMPNHQPTNSMKHQYRSQEAMTRWLEESKKEAVWNHLAVLQDLDHSPMRRKL